MSARVLLVDDHPLFLQSLETLLAMSGRFEIVGTATNGKDAIRQAYQLKPDLVVLDLRMADTDGPDTIERLKRQVPTAKIMVLTADTDKETLRTALAAGCDGYAIKTDDPDEVELLMKATVAGHCAISWRLVHHLVPPFLATVEDHPDADVLVELNDHDKAIIRLTAEGKTAAEIAHLLKARSKRQIDYQRTKLRQQTGYDDLVAFAFDVGLVE